MEWLFGSNKKESAEGVKPKGSLGTSTPNEVDDSWYRDKGNEAFEQADYHEALSLYTQGIVRQPSAVLYCNRSATAFALGDYKLALEDADRSLAMDGTWVKPFLRKGRALSALGRYKEAANVMANGLSLSISGVKEKTRQIETELEIVKKQAQGQSDAYLALVEKNQHLERQLQDYRDMFGDWAKKQS